ncbi:recombinase family protein [Nocardia sp. NPDC088792]|uniref:recombinase family protein n=1 Tax=Nocardia sp. NPDC088792 TaxID=3364332 RepID=UPI00381A67E6
MQQLRALVGARVSVYRGDDKTSNVTQVKTATEWVERNGHIVVGTFEDLDISADKYSPFERPGLGPWLTDERAHEWDVLVFSKTDRVFRKAEDCADVARWIENHGKVLVLVDDNQVLNFREDSSGFERTMAKFFLMIAAFFAEMELERVRSRIKDTHRTLRQTQRWMNGTPSLGFTTAEAPDGRGRVLVHDPEGQATLHDIAYRLFAGHSWNKIAQAMNADGVLTNGDRARIARGGEPKKNPWAPTTLIDIMTSPITQGIKVDKHKHPILDADGHEITMAEPSFSQQDWDRIQAEVAKRKNRGKQRVHSANPMLGVGFCGRCGSTLSQKVSRNREDGPEYRYYRCGNAKNRCAGVNIRADIADQALEAQFLDHYGPRPVTKKVLVPGSDHRAELERIQGGIDRLKAESDAGLLEMSTDEYVTRLGQLSVRKRTLEANPITPPRWDVETTGESFAEAWASAEDNETRRNLLADRGLRFELFSSVHYGLVDLMDTEDGYAEWQARWEAENGPSGLMTCNKCGQLWPLADSRDGNCGRCEGLPERVEPNPWVEWDWARSAERFGTNRG